jgi:hypothetical protein
MAKPTVPVQPVTNRYQPLAPPRIVQPAGVIQPAGLPSSPAAQVDAPPPSYVEPETTASNQQFDLMRKQVAERNAAASQGQQDVLNRRLARLGNLNSGAALKQSQNLEDSINKQNQESMGQIDVSQAAANAQNEQAAMQRSLQNTQFERSFGEQRRQNSFTEGLALDEAKLNRFNTMYNTALSAEQSGAKAQIAAIYKEMFGENLSFDSGEQAQSASASNKVGVKASPAAAAAFGLTPKSFKGSVIYTDRDIRDFKKKAKAAGYSSAEINAAIKYGGG